MIWRTMVITFIYSFLVIQLIAKFYCKNYCCHSLRSHVLSILSLHAPPFSPSFRMHLQILSFSSWLICKHCAFHACYRIARHWLCPFRRRKNCLQSQFSCEKWNMCILRFVMRFYDLFVSTLLCCIEIFDCFSSKMLFAVKIPAYLYRLDIQLDSALSENSVMKNLKLLQYTLNLCYFKQPFSFFYEVNVIDLSIFAQNSTGRW